MQCPRCDSQMILDWVKIDTWMAFCIEKGCEYEVELNGHRNV